GGDRRMRRPHRGALRGSAGGDRRDAAGAGQAAASLHARSDGLDPRYRAAGGGASPDSRNDAAARCNAGRMRIPRALRRCRGDLPERAAGAGAKGFGTGRLLVRRRPSSHGDGPVMSGAAGTILSVDGLSVRFDVSSSPLARLLLSTGKRVVYAVEDVSFRVEKGTTFALVGESGCGKTTIARTIVGIQVPTSGSISFMGRDVTRPGRSREARKDRRNIQMIFQDPYSSLNPRWRVGRIIAEPIVTHGLEESRNVAARVGELLELVGLSRSDANKFPHQFSGGQRQRVSIARALASNPAFIVCDEPTSALDVSVQAQILNLMKDLQRELGRTYLFISHNLAVVDHVADRVGDMYLGRVV